MIERLNSLLTWIKRAQRVNPDSHPVKVNVGSYLVVQDGWINVEGTFHAFLAKRPALVAKLMYRYSKVNRVVPSESEYLAILNNYSFVHHDLKYGLPFPDCCADFVYASHVLEHFYPDAAQHLLQEAARILKPGGRVRICVPDLKHAINLYLQGKKVESLEYFFQDEATANFHRHKYMYDFEIMKSALEQAGFTSVRQCAYREGEVPDIDKLDNRPEETLYVEAVACRVN